MTQPIDARHRLDTAVRVLVEPHVHELHRADPILDSAAAQLARDDRAVERELEARHALYLRSRQHGQARRALTALIDHRRRVATRVEQQRVATAEEAALLDQLEAEVGSSTSGPGEGAGAKSTRSVIGLAAAQLIGEIRAEVGARRDDHLAERVTAWARAVEDEEHAAHLAESWVTSISELLNPPRRISWPGACPDCHRRIVERLDDAGQIVREPVLELDAEGQRARCRVCPARWVGPEQLRQLAGVLEEEQAGERAWMTG